MNAPSSKSAKKESPCMWRLSSGPGDLTDNEVAWVEFLRMISNGRDPRPTLRRVQLLRRVCGKF